MRVLVIRHFRTISSLGKINATQLNVKKRKTNEKMTFPFFNKRFVISSLFYEKIYQVTALLYILLHGYSTRLGHEQLEKIKYTRAI